LLLNDNFVREEIKKEIKEFLELNENVDTSYPNLWGHSESSAKRKIRSALVKKLERFYTSNLTA
jgi:hypothetical protein